jgi:2-amino-4-hydroxy-6-hydroxymethyldihydropteridine diphosphokinase
MVRIIFGIGSNLGDREFYLKQAVEEITNQLELVNPKKSSIFKNPAMLLENSPQEWNIEFFNIAFSADINLKKFSPEKILQIIKAIEKKLGRKESSKWAPREVDIDILVIEGLEVKIDGFLEIPHPGLFNRDFFIKTVEEIEGGFAKYVGRKMLRQAWHD